MPTFRLDTNDTFLGTVIESTNPQLSRLAILVTVLTLSGDLTVAQQAAIMEHLSASPQSPSQRAMSREFAQHKLELASACLASALPHLSSEISRFLDQSQPSHTFSF